MDKTFYYIFIGKIIWFMAAGVTALGQVAQPLHWECSEEDRQVLVQEKLWDIEVDSIHFNRVVESAVKHLRGRGYLLTRVEQVDNSSALISIGGRYQWVNLSTGNVPADLLRAAGYADKLYTNKPFNYRQAARLLNKMVTISEQRGYPFALVKLDSVHIDGTKVAASLYYQAGPNIKFDTLSIGGTAKIDPVFLASYLKTKPRTPYNQKEVENIEGRLQQLDYVSLSSPVGITFANNEAELQLDLQHVKSNHIDGIVGFLPGENEDNKLLITGQLDLELNNPFKRGKNITVNWQAIKPLNQTFNLAYYHPALLKGPLNLFAELKLLKEDTTFFNREILVGAEVSLSAFWKASLFTSHKNGSLLSTVAYEGATKLPDLLDYEVKEYGFSFKYSKLNILNNPTRGLACELKASLGNKVISKNPGIAEALYSEVNLNTTVYRLEGEVKKYTKLPKHLVVYNQLSSSHLFNSSLLLNELYRVGGLRSLRGFNQNEFFAAQYAVLTNELRLYFESSSYLFAFYDQGIIHYDLNQLSLDDEPFGFGIGVSMNTGSGIFNFAYGLGKSKSQPLAFNLSKIHFGYVAKF